MSEHIKDSYYTIAHEWTLNELVEAHLVLDAMDDFAALAKAGI